MLKGANLYCVYIVLREAFIVALTKCFYSKLDNVVCCSFWCTWILLYLGSFNNHQLGFLSAKRTLQSPPARSTTIVTIIMYFSTYLCFAL